MALFDYSPLVSKFLLAALLFSHKKVGGVQCFASGTSASRLKSTTRNSCTTFNFGNGRHSHDAWESNNKLNSLPLSQKCRQRNGDIMRQEMVSISSSSDLEGDNRDDDPKLKSETTTTMTTKQLNVRGGGDTTTVPSRNSEEVRAWPCGDALDRKLIKIALPCIANFAINPLVGAVDLFWINRMGNTLAVAGQAAANQIFSSAFWLTSFLPSVTATLVAKEHAKGSEEGVQDAVSQALIVGTMVALFGSAMVLSRPDRLLGGVLKSGAPAREFARPYLLIRGFAFLPSLLSLIGFSSFRGTMDTVTPLKISLFANLLNAVMDPILIFNAKMGVTGAALATLFSEICSALLFMTLMWQRNLIRASKLFRIPKLENLMPLLKGGAALQLRNFALNLTFLAVTRVTQSIDDTGVAAAAHAMAIQTFQIGGIVLLALSTVAQFVVPGDMVEKVDAKTGAKSGGAMVARATMNRLMSWGFILGTILGFLQILILPNLLKATPIEDVRVAARVPALLGSVYQCFNGLVFIGEGVMVGTGSFMQLSISTVIATLATLLALQELPQKLGLTGVWMSFGVFNTLRLAGVFVHQYVNGPLSKRVIARNQSSLEETTSTSTGVESDNSISDTQEENDTRQTARIE